MDWIDLAEDRDQWKAIVNSVRNLRVPKNAGNLLSGCTIGSFSGKAELHERVSEMRTCCYVLPKFKHWIEICILNSREYWNELKIRPARTSLKRTDTKLIQNN
jgi:hypothetical protein